MFLAGAHPRGAPTRGELQDLEEAVEGSVCAAVADPEREDAIQPVVMRRCGFKARAYPEVIRRGIDVFALL